MPIYVLICHLLDIMAKHGTDIKVVGYSRYGKEYEITDVEVEADKKTVQLCAFNDRNY